MAKSIKNKKTITMIKTYKAILSQYDTDNPVAEVYEDSIGTIVLTREEAGVYNISSSSTDFDDLSKIFCPQITPTNQDNSIVYNRIGYGNFYIAISKSDTPYGILITVRDKDFNYSDEFLKQFPIQIEVYP